MKEVGIIVITDICRDYESSGCLQTPDPAYTMRFDDIGEEPLKFCSACGPANFKLQVALEEALQDMNPEQVDKLARAITNAENERS